MVNLGCPLRQRMRKKPQCRDGLYLDALCCLSSVGNIGGAKLADTSGGRGGGRGGRIRPVSSFLFFLRAASMGPLFAAARLAPSPVDQAAEMPPASVPLGLLLQSAFEREREKKNQ